MKSKDKYINKNHLILVGFNENTAGEIIRCVKTYLAREGCEFYLNPRIGFVPTERIIEFLIGVSGKELSPERAIDFLKDEIVHRDELINWGIPKVTANKLIKQAQQKVAGEGLIFYENTRRWFAPTKHINKLLGGN